MRISNPPHTIAGKAHVSLRRVNSAEATIIKS
jgi:hypothetical protein